MKKEEFTMGKNSVHTVLYVPLVLESVGLINERLKE